jgi:outer membrane receptor protein involved in Fe transport
MSTRRAVCLRIITFVAFLLSPGAALAGTTGSLSGVVTEAEAAHDPVSRATVIVASLAQTLTAVTDRHGRFTFLSLIPDTYVLSVEKPGYDAISRSDLAILADQNQTITLQFQHHVEEIGHVSAQAGGNIVKPGMTADVYSIDAVTAEKARALGGGGSLNQLYSGLALLPGVVVPPGQNGWNQAAYIRGSSFNQTGFEYDGVPVNRAFDNYNASTGSSLGQQELQVYAGGAPAGASSTGEAGYINQVIRTGTYPGFADLTLGMGSPTFYHNLRLEVGGASPDRNFSYFLGFSGSGQDFRYVDQFNGASASAFGAPLSLPNTFTTGVAPLCQRGALMRNCYFFGPLNIELPAHVSDREVVGNFHVALPHRNDAGKDDVQLLYANSAMNTSYADSVNDLVADGALPAGAHLPYTNGVTFPNGTQFGQSATGLSSVSYGFPSAYPGNANINPFHRDGFLNDAAIVKLQYQKNFGSNAYARVYGYTFYSDWLANAPDASSAPFILPAPLPPDYELSSHTRGVNIQLADEIASRHLLQFTANFVGATSTRVNNTTMFNAPKTPSTNLVDASGNCYDARGARGTCNPDPADPTYGTFGNPTPFVPPAGSPAALNGAQWIVSNPGITGTYNTVAPHFSSFALTDTWHPSDKLNINGGVRFERFRYGLASTNAPGQNFWATTAQNEACYNPGTFAFSGFSLTCNGSDLHPNGKNGAILYTNAYPSTYALSVTEPRLAGAYTLNPDTVLRASYGRYAEPPSTSSIQYIASQPNTPGAFYAKFSQAGLAASPFHPVRPATSNNVDFSLEKHFKGTDMSVKITPFYKVTQNALQEVYLDQVQQFASEINAGTQKSHGLELQFTKGHFDREGLALSLSYTYTDTRIRYQNIGGSSVNAIDQINASIQKYNAFTAAGGGAPCYAVGSGAALSTCAGNPTAIQNPYYASPVQALLDRGGWYVPFEFTPAVNDSAQVSYLVPHVVSLLLNYKKHRLSISPSIQLFAGQPYGAPLNQIGWDPTSCSANQMGIPTAVSAGRGQYADWTSCAGKLNIPNYETGTFDRQGAYTQPTDVQTNLQIGYEASKNVKLSLMLANVYNKCFGGSKMPWTNGGTNVCGYGLDFTGLGQGVSNFYNGASPFDAAANGGASALPYNTHAYTAQGGGNPVIPISQPLQIYLNAQIRL